MAKVMDALGNPVENETVVFTIGSTSTNPSLPSPLNLTPVFLINNLTTLSATTNENGFATVQYRPGSFVTAGPNYNQTATGTTAVQAAWNGRMKTINITFKNYPYLRVETEVSPQTLVVNDTADVTIRLIGDGWALQQKPIDVMLVIDRSGSMGRNYVAPGVSRMRAAKNAANIFVDEMDPGTDRIGLVSYSYENSVTLNAALGTSYSTVHSRINNLNADGGTAMREGFRKAIEHMAANPNSNAVRAVILMTDGNWNNGGSPLAIGKGYQDTTWVTNNRAIDVGSSRYHGFSSLANHFEEEDYRWYTGLGGTIVERDGVQVVRMPITIDESTGMQTGSRTYRTLNDVRYCSDGQFTSQNMSIYASSNGLRLYTISFAQNVPASEREALTILANSTGGFYRHAPTEEELTQVYTQIAGDLKTVAGINTQMNLSFQDVNVTFNNLTTSYDGDEVFSYQYLSGISTNITSWNNSGILLDHIPLPSYPNVTPNFGSYTTYPYSYDQTSDWEGSPTRLFFNVGNVSVNQTWQTTFRLMVKKEGSINIFGSGSGVNFEGAEGITNIPDTFITAIANMTMEAANQTTLDVAITGTNDDGSGNVTEILDIYWNLDYSGNRTVQQDFYYQFSDDNVIWSGSWVHGGSITTGTGPIHNISQTGGIDVRGKSGWMKIKVTAKEQLVGGKYDEDYWPQVIRVGPGDKIYIRIT
jgi:Mg-chelatase subunit ChlD